MHLSPLWSHCGLDRSRSSCVPRFFFLCRDQRSLVETKKRGGREGGKEKRKKRKTKTTLDHPREIWFEIGLEKIIEIIVLKKNKFTPFARVVDQQQERDEHGRRKEDFTANHSDGAYTR